MPEYSELNEATPDSVQRCPFVLTSNLERAGSLAGGHAAKLGPDIELPDVGEAGLGFPRAAAPVGESKFAPMPEVEINPKEEDWVDPAALEWRRSSNRTHPGTPEGRGFMDPPRGLQGNAAKQSSRSAPSWPGLVPAMTWLNSRNGKYLPPILPWRSTKSWQFPEVLAAQRRGWPGQARP
jgi:hypothetical protein